VKAERGEYLERKEVTDFQKNILYIIKSKVLSLGDNLPPKLPGKNHKQKRKIIRDACIEILEELSQIERWKEQKSE